MRSTYGWPEYSSTYDGSVIWTGTQTVFGCYVDREHEFVLCCCFVVPGLSWKYAPFIILRPGLVASSNLALVIFRFLPFATEDLCVAHRKRLFVPKARGIGWFLFFFCAAVLFAYWYISRAAFCSTSFCDILQEHDWVFPFLTCTYSELLGDFSPKKTEGLVEKATGTALLGRISDEPPKYTS